MIHELKRPDLFETEKQLKEEQEDGQHRETVTVTLAAGGVRDRRRGMG